jgi:S-adenosylmethionine hydrolase
VITLASDFGSPYPAAMKGVIASHTDTQLIDVAHDFPRQEVHTAAFWLREVLPSFPPAVHLVVVDPGVGTDRAALVLRAGDHALVGPDNGVIAPAARRLAGTDAIEAFAIDDGDAASSTFHGRDVFAPAAAAVQNRGIDALETLDRLSPVAEYEDLTFPDPDVGDDRIQGTVLVVDGFGNVITNVPGSALADVDAVTVDGQRVPVVATFGMVSPGERLVTVGSHGNLELDVNQGRGDAAFGLEPGDAVVIECQ